MQQQKLLQNTNPQIEATNQISDISNKVSKNFCNGNFHSHVLKKSSSNQINRMFKSHINKNGYEHKIYHYEALH